MSYSTGKRLEFERDVLASGNTPVRVVTKKSRGRLLPIVAILTLLGGAAVAGGAFASRSGFFGSERRSVTRMATTLVHGLSQSDAAGALEACAAGTTTSKLIQKEESKVFGENAVGPLDTVEHELETLKALRSELESKGVSWADVTPLSFGGVRARVEGDGMIAPLTVLTGEIYFKSRGQVFAIEISAWRCDGQYVIVDMWKGFPVSDSVSDLKAYSAEQAARLQREASEGKGLLVSYLKQVYVEF